MPGFSRQEIVQAETNWGCAFPPDLVELLLEKRLLPDGHEFSCMTDDPKMRQNLRRWPFRLLASSAVINYCSWPPTWGPRPETPLLIRARIRHLLQQAPRLISLSGHRFLPAEPRESANPIFSMHGFDTIYYGYNLSDWLTREYGERRWPKLDRLSNYKQIRFWSHLVEWNVAPPIQTPSSSKN